MQLYNAVHCTMHKCARPSITLAAGNYIIGQRRWELWNSHLPFIVIVIIYIMIMIMIISHQSSVIIRIITITVLDFFRKWFSGQNIELCPSILNYYRGLKNGPPCCHLPQCFPHNNWYHPWDMEGSGGGGAQMAKMDPHKYIFDCESPSHCKYIFDIFEVSHSCNWSTVAKWIIMATDTTIAGIWRNRFAGKLVITEQLEKKRSIF